MVSRKALLKLSDHNKSAKLSWIQPNYMPSDVIATTSASSPALRRRRVLLVAAVLICVAIDSFLAWELRLPITSGSTDFMAFYSAGRFVTEGNGAGLFERSPLVSAPFTHAPYEALLFVPLAHFAYEDAVWIWCVFNILLAYLCLYVLLPHLPGVAANPEFAVLAVGIFAPVLIAEFNGQDSFLTLLMLSICFKCLVRERAWWAGSALALACFKPPLAIPMFILILSTCRRKSVVAAGALGTGGLLLLLSDLAVGWKGILAYPRFLSAYAAGPDQYHESDMPNVRGIATWILQTHVAHATLIVIVGLASVAVLTIAVFSARMSRSRVAGAGGNDHLTYALFITATILVAFHEYAYDLVLLLIPILLVWNWSATQSQLARRSLLRFSPPGLILSSPLLFFKPPVFACAIALFFALLCVELLKSSKLEIQDPESAQQFA
jgi:hypothetical protein